MKNVLIIAGLCTALLTSTGCKSQEDHLVGHIEEIAEIMTDGKEEPVEGVQDLRDYLHDNLPEISKQMMSLLMELDKMEDPKARAERIKEVIEAFKAPAAAVIAAGPGFMEAVAKSEAAQAESQKSVTSWAQTAMQLGDVLKDLSGFGLDGMLKELM
jgi:hypothetical protein